MKSIEKLEEIIRDRDSQIQQLELEINDLNARIVSAEMAYNDLKRSRNRIASVIMNGPKMRPRKLYVSKVHFANDGVHIWVTA